MPFALYLLALVVFAMSTSEFMLAGLVPDISAYFGVSVGTAGLLTSAFAAGMVIGAPAMAAFTRPLPVKATLTMLLAALVNAGTFASLTFLAPIVTETADLRQLWVPVALVLFGVGSFIGITVAGRLSDARPRLVIVAGGSTLLLGWIALALVAANPVALLALVFVQGFLGFAVGSTLITRVLYAAAGAPTMAGSYATAALNVGAAVGPTLAAAALGVMPGALGPVWVAVLATAAALLLAVPLLPLIAPAEREAVK